MDALTDLSTHLLMHSVCQCQNGGVCSGSTCSCPPGYTGTRCETPCPTSCPAGYYINNCNCGKLYGYAYSLVFSWRKVFDKEVQWEGFIQERIQPVHSLKISVYVAVAPVVGFVAVGSISLPYSALCIFFT